MTPFQMEILPLDLVYVWSSVCGNEDRLDDAIHLTLVMARAGRIKWTSVVFIFIFIFIFIWVCVLSLPSGKCQTWCWLIPSQRTFLRTTSGKSTGEFIAGFRGVGRTELGKKRGGMSRGWEDAGMSKKQKPCRDVKKRNGREDWEKRSVKRRKEDDKELWGAERSR